MPSYDASNRRITLSEREAIAMILFGVVSFGAINGIATSCAISYISSLSPLFAGLSPVIVGGMIGVGLLTSLLIIRLLVKGPVYGPRGFPKELARAVAYTGTAFGVGAGLVALGVTSPAAIGAFTLLALTTLVKLIEPPSSFIEVKNTCLESTRVKNAATAFRFVVT